MRKDSTVRRHHNNVHKWLIFKSGSLGWALCTPKYDYGDSLRLGSTITYHSSWEEAVEALWN